MSSGEARTARGWGDAQHQLALIALLGIAICLIAYRTTLLEMMRLWATSGTYAHGWLVLPICVALAWRQRKELAMLVPHPSPWGIVAIVGLVLVWIAAGFAHVLVVQELALIFLLPAIVLATCGWAHLRRVAFPCAFAVFAVPFGESLTEPLMEVTATGTVVLLRTAGVPVFRDGMFFSTTVGDFEVAEACSGIRYLIAFLSIGTLYAYLALRTWPYRAAFVLLAAIVPVIANVLRAFLIVMIAHASDMRHAVGVDHLIYGSLFFVIVLFGLLSLGEVLRRMELRRVHAKHAPAEQGPSPESSIAAPNPGLRRLLIALVCIVPIVIGPIALATIERAVAVPTQAPYGVPLGVAEWSGPLEPSPAWRPEFQGDARTTLARYAHPAFGDITLAVTHYVREGQHGELTSSTNRLANTERWRELRASSHRIADGPRVRAARYAGLNRDVQLTIWSAYVLNGRAVAGVHEAKLMGGLERLRNPESPAVHIALAHLGDEVGSERALQAFAASHLAAVLACSRTHALIREHQARKLCAPSKDGRLAQR